MDKHDTTKIKEFWEGRGSEQTVPSAEVTHRDIWQRWLEIEMLKRFVRPADRVLDIGCGNGYTTRRLSPLVREIVGMDYAEAMIERARADTLPSEPSTMRFQVGDVLKLNPDTAGMFDVAVTERCLINLGSWEEQQQAIANIASVLKPGGRLLFVEGYKDGRDHLDAMRRQFGLETMPVVWHNIDFEETRTLAYLGRFFDLEQKLHFGVYDFLARVVNPLLSAPEPPQYDSKINEIAARLALDLQDHGSISRVLFLVLVRQANA